MKPELMWLVYAVGLTFVQMLFAALVLVAVLAGRTNAMTLLGAQIFVWARLAYALVYMAGVPWLRTAVWFASVIGLALIFFQLL